MAGVRTTLPYLQNAGAGSPQQLSSVGGASQPLQTGDPSNPLGLTAAQYAMLQSLIPQAETGIMTHSGAPTSAIGSALSSLMLANGFSPAQAQAALGAVTNWGGQHPGGGFVQQESAGSAGLSPFTSDISQFLGQAGLGVDPNAASPQSSAAGVMQGATQSNLTPSYLSSILPGGQIPTVNPIDVIGATEGYMLPQFQQQDQALQEALANAGIVGGSTGKAFADQGTQQQLALMNAVQPFLQNTALANQNAILGASEFQAGQGTNAGISAANMANQDWLAQMGAQGGLSGQGMGILGGSFQPNYQQPAQVNYSGLASSFAPQPNYNFNIPSNYSPYMTPSTTPFNPGGGQGGDLGLQPSYQP